MIVTDELNLITVTCKLSLTLITVTDDITLRVQNEPFSEEQGFILRYIEKEV